VRKTNLIEKTVPQARNGNENGGSENGDVVEEQTDVSAVEASTGTIVEDVVHRKALK